MCNNESAFETMNLSGLVLILVTVVARKLTLAAIMVLSIVTVL